MSTIQFALISDLHLEFYINPQKLIRLLHLEKNKEQHKNTILLLAGDIGWPLNNKIKKSMSDSSRWEEKDCINQNYVSFLRVLRSHFRQVIMVSGNHEYFGSRGCINLVDKIIHNICKDLDIIFLQKETITVDGIKISGCTLFSLITPEAYDRMNDAMGMTMQEQRDRYRDHSNWLKEQEDVDIVMTHYLTSKHLIDDKYKNGDNSGYYTQLTLPYKPKVIVSGHTHTKKDIILEDVQHYINPLGYPNENRNVGFVYFTLTIN